MPVGRSDFTAEMMRKPLSRKDIKKALEDVYAACLIKPPSGSTNTGVAFWSGFAAEVLGKRGRGGFTDRIDLTVFEAGREARRRIAPVSAAVLHQVCGRMEPKLYLALLDIHVEQMRDALAFYADKSNWRAAGVGSGTSLELMRDPAPSAIDRDAQGGRARKALGIED